MQNLGYQFLISVLLPGSVVFASIWIALAEVAPQSRIYLWTTRIAESDVSLTTVLLLGSALLGGILSSLMERIELHILDSTAAEYLQIDRELYDEEWECYVESLSDKQNPYVARKATYFFFEIRVGAALAIASAVSVVISPCTWISYVPLMVAVGMLLLARQTHSLLASWRHRLFEAQAVKNLGRETHGE